MNQQLYYQQRITNSSSYVSDHVDEIDEIDDIQTSNNKLKLLNDSLKKENESLLKEQQQLKNENQLVKDIVSLLDNVIKKHNDDLLNKLINQYGFYPINHINTTYNKEEACHNVPTKHNETQCNYSTVVNAPSKEIQDDSFSVVEVKNTSYCKADCDNSKNGGSNMLSWLFNSKVSLPEKKLNLYYFAKDSEYYIPMYNFVTKINSVPIRGLNEKVKITLVKGPSIYNDIEVEKCSNHSYQSNKKKIALYSIFVSGSRADWDIYKKDVQYLQNLKYNVVIVFFKPGKLSEPIYYENFKGIQITLKVLKKEVYADKDNFDQFNSLFNAIYDLKD